jgi:rubrerythrin
MDYNEMDDYGTGFEEMAERKYEEMIVAQVREMVEEPAYDCRGCGSPVDRPNASCGCPMA